MKSVEGSKHVVREPPDDSRQHFGKHHTLQAKKPELQPDSIPKTIEVKIKETDNRPRHFMAAKSNHQWRIVHSEASTGWGGQERRIMAELVEFQQRGCDVALIAPATSKIYERAVAANITVQPAVFGKINFFLNLIRLARWLRQNQTQVLNTHSSRDGWLIGIAGRLARVPLIIRTRHIDVDYPNRWLSRHAFTTLADHVLTTSDRITEHVQEIFHLPDDNITTLPTGIDLNLFSEASEKAQLISGNGKEPLIGMVSVLRSWKGHVTFLDAAAQLKSAGCNFRFVIVGEGPMRQRIIEMIAERFLGDVVTMVGHVENVSPVLRGLSVLAIPSTKHEGVPQIGLQALAVKTPVVGSDVGGIPEIIRSGETGRIFPGGNATALAAAIKETLSDIAQTNAMTTRGRALVESHHSLDAMLNKLDALYHRCIPNPN